jgi:leucyl/phenylalanyl-tRNA--protein transferase
MAETRDDPRVFLVDPELRGVIPLDGFHIASRLGRTVRQDRFEVKIDTAFEAVVDACAQPHSVECWQEGELRGGLYGVSLGGAFFGESMFSDARDASKVALVHLVARLVAGGYRLLDAQFQTEHLSQFGAEEIGRAVYRLRLAEALEVEADFFALPSRINGRQALQATSQAS